MSKIPAPLHSFFQAFQKALPGQYDAHVAHDRLDNDTRYVLVLVDDASHAIEMVELRNKGVTRKIGRDTRAVRDAVGFKA